MRPRSLLLLILGACTAAAPVAPSIKGATSSPADTAQETHADTAEPEDTAIPDSGDPPVEEVPGAPWTDPLTELCQIVLDCETALSGEKTACQVEVRREDGSLEDAGPAVAWWRGRSSYHVAKHSYGVELRDEAGEARSVNLLGMGGESDWMIDGLYYDRLLVRDKLGYDLFQSFAEEGRYAAQSALCELTLDGKYEGVVALVERIKRDDDRLDLSRENDGEAWVMGQGDKDCFRWNTTTYGCFKLMSPDDDDVDEAAAATMTAFLDGWEAANASATPFAEGASVLDYLDLDSAIDLILLEELFKNEDCFYTSLHLWKDAGGKVHWVPWDLDMTFGQFPDYYDYGNPERWIQYRPQMWTVLTEHPEFHDQMAARWAELRAGPLDTDALHARIDALQEILGPAVDRNFERWPIANINYGTLFYPVASYEEEDAHVREWMEIRLAFMDAHVGEW